MNIEALHNLCDLGKIFCIYIPTYHRHNALKACVHSIIVNIEKFHCPVDIYISNNDKSDIETRQTAAQLKEIYSHIYYSENEVNLGIDGNMRGGVLIKQNKYCLLLGDDDGLADFAFVAIYNIIKTYHELSFIILGTSLKQGPRTSFLYEDKQQCFKDCYDKTPFGTVIYNLEIARKIENELDKYMGTYHLYSGACWEMLKIKDRAYMSGLPSIIKDEKEEKTYNDWDVCSWNIPKWYDILPKEYQAYAQSAKLLDLCILYIDTDDEIKREELLYAYPELVDVLAYVRIQER